MLYRLVRATKVDKKTGPAQLFSRCLQAISGGGILDFKLGLYLSDSRHGGVSAVERVARVFPVLRKCIVEVTDPVDKEFIPYKAIITRRHGPWPRCQTDGAQLESLPAELVSEIAAGVPKRWPADEFRLVIDVGSWPGMPAPVIDETAEIVRSPWLGESTTAYLRPSLLIGSLWWTPRRVNYLMAIAPFASTGDEPTLPISADTLKVFADLGPAGTNSVNAVMSESELSKSKLLHARLKESAKAYVNDAQQLLRPVPEAETGMFRLGDSAAKEAILRAFRGMRYKYTWLARGAYRLVKFSPTGYRCVVDVDVAPMARLVAVEYGVEGPSISIRVPVPTCMGDQPSRQQPIDPPERLDCLLDNAARVVTYYEEQLLPMLEQNLPQCPRWLKSL